MKRIPMLGVCLMLMLGMMSGAASATSRLIILADMGNEPDEEQQMAHMIMCSNEFELEGLIAVSGIYLRPEAKDPYRRVPLRRHTAEEDAPFAVPLGDLVSRQALSCRLMHSFVVGGCRPGSHYSRRTLEIKR